LEKLVEILLLLIHHNGAHSAATRSTACAEWSIGFFVGYTHGASRTKPVEVRHTVPAVTILAIDSTDKSSGKRSITAATVKTHLSESKSTRNVIHTQISSTS
jgi:hypothetical protein